MARPKIIVHNHFRRPARDATWRVEFKVDPSFRRNNPQKADNIRAGFAEVSASSEAEAIQKAWQKQRSNTPEALTVVSARNLTSASDTYYHEGQVNGYYILRGEVGDKGRYLVRNGKYDIVKTAGSKAEAISFAKKSPHGGIKEPEQQQAADSMKLARGIYYFDSYSSARAYANEHDLPTDRIISYGLGWAIQFGKSGSYAGPGSEAADTLFKFSEGARVRLKLASGEYTSQTSGPGVVKQATRSPSGTYYDIKFPSGLVRTIPESQLQTA